MTIIYIIYDYIYFDIHYIYDMYCTSEGRKILHIRGVRLLRVDFQ